MTGIVPPKYVRHILITLQSRGHLAYLVGGCVRDMLLGVRPHDWDICTSALPDEIMALFPSSRPTGLQHGTVTVVVDSRSVEVTTFRTEGKYADHRRPESVSFVGDLNIDLGRRDFTMNAIALPVNGLIADPFGGVEDIEAKCIRCVGNPELRFEEDALRMFRAMRFSAKLGFDIEEETLAAIGHKANLAAGLAAERVRDEVERTLLTPAPQTVARMMRFGLMDKFLLRRFDGDEEAYSLLSSVPKKPLDRWCVLCLLLLRDRLIASPGEFLHALRLDTRTIRCCDDCAHIISYPLPETAPEWKRLLRDYGADTVLCSARCRDAVYGGGSLKRLKAVLKSGECFSAKYLAVNGDDLISLGYNGRELGEMLAFLLDYVIDHPENNRREVLLALAATSEE